jgi:hypothetical protein
LSFLELTVLTKSKTGSALLRRHREERPARVAGRAEAQQAPEPTGNRSSAARRRREAGAPTDAAMYACHCGFVFQALVSTSVDCPHCGGAQAW